MPLVRKVLLTIAFVAGLVVFAVAPTGGTADAQPAPQPGCDYNDYIAGSSCRYCDYNDYIAGSSCRYCDYNDYIAGAPCAYNYFIARGQCSDDYNHYIAGTIERNDWWCEYLAYTRDTTTVARQRPLPPSVLAGEATASAAQIGSASLLWTTASATTSAATTAPLAHTGPQDGALLAGLTMLGLGSFAVAISRGRQAV